MARRHLALLLKIPLILGVGQTTALETQVQTGQPLNVTFYNSNQGTRADPYLFRVLIEWVDEELSKVYFECLSASCTVPDNVKLLVDRTVVSLEHVTKSGNLTCEVSFRDKRESTSTVEVVVEEPAKKPEPKSITDAPAPKKPHTNGRVCSLGSTIGTDFVCLFVTLLVGHLIRLALQTN